MFFFSFLLKRNPNIYIFQSNCDVEISHDYICCLFHNIRNNVSELGGTLSPPPKKGQLGSLNENRWTNLCLLSVWLGNLSRISIFVKSKSVLSWVVRHSGSVLSRVVKHSGRLLMLFEARFICDVIFWSYSQLWFVWKKYYYLNALKMQISQKYHTLLTIQMLRKIVDIMDMR